MATTEERTQTGARTARDEQLAGLVPKRSMKKEVLVGALAIAGVTAVLIALFTLTDAGTFRNRYIVRATVENAGGIRKGDPVQMRGVNIGRIYGFGIVPGGVEVALELEGEYDVPVDSRMVLQSGGLLGGRIAEVVPGNATEYLENGDVIPGASTTGLSEVTGDLTAGADVALERINALLSEQNVGAAGASIVELRATLEAMSALVAEQRRELAALTGSMQGAATNLEATTGELRSSEIIANLDRLTAQADETSQSLQRASTSLESLIARMERGEGTLGKLMQDDALYTNLNEAAASVRMLAQDIRANPKRYIDVSVF